MKGLHMILVITIFSIGIGVVLILVLALYIYANKHRHEKHASLLDRNTSLVDQNMQLSVYCVCCTHSYDCFIPYPTSLQ